MTRPLYLLTVAAVLALASCGEDDPMSTGQTADVTVAFRGTVGQEPLALESSTYQAAGVADGYRYSRVSFFVSEVELISETTAGELGTDVAEIGYVEFGPSGESALDVAGVPRGDYVGLRFNLGLTGEQDALQPQDYAAGHPLADASEYWVDWGSYIFLKLEGRSDTLADGRARFDQRFVYHVGKAAELTRRIEVRMPITVSGETAALGVDVDVATLLGLGGAEPLSLTGVADHSNGAAARIMENAARAFSRRE